MSLFGMIVSKVFGDARPTAEAARSALTGIATSAGQADSEGRGLQGSGGQPPSGWMGAQADVDTILSEMAAKKVQPLDWRHSIIDLMVLLGMDPSLAIRKQLAEELGYSGDKNDIAAMNFWLVKEVMHKLTEYDDHLPSDLRR